jgi:hypothetical protein
VTSALTPLLTKASVTIFLVLLKTFVTCSFLIEDASVGDFMKLCLSSYDFYAKSLFSFGLDVCISL